MKVLILHKSCISVFPVGWEDCMNEVASMLKRQKKHPEQHMWADSMACWPEWETCLHKFLQMQRQMQKIR